MDNGSWLSDLLEFYTPLQKKEIILSVMKKFKNDELLKKMKLKRQRDYYGC